MTVDTIQKSTMRETSLVKSIESENDPIQSFMTRLVQPATPINLVIEARNK